MKEKHFLIVYDVSDGRRRYNLVKELLKCAYRVQESVFEMRAKEEVCDALKKRIPEIIDEDEDSAIVYEFSDVDWEKRRHFGAERFSGDLYENGFAIL